MKWSLVGFFGFGCILAISASSGVTLFGQLPNGNGQNRSFVSNSPAFQPAPNPPYVQPNTQQPLEFGPSPGMSNRYRPVTLTGPDGKTFTRMESVPRDQKHEEARQALYEAQSKLVASDATESDKKEARTAIEKFLEDEFERDQKIRREQVTRLEEHVSKLRKQLEKRDQSKSKIIELRMQLMENDAEGLSFPESFNELQRYDVNHTQHGPMPGGMLPLNPPVYSSPVPPWVSPSPLTTRELIDLRNQVPGQPMPPNMNQPTEAKRP